MPLFLSFRSPGSQLSSFICFSSLLRLDTIALSRLGLGSFLDSFWTLLLDLFSSAVLPYLTKPVPTAAKLCLWVLLGSLSRGDGTFLHFAHGGGVDFQHHGGPDYHSSVMSALPCLWCTHQSSMALFLLASLHLASSNWCFVELYVWCCAADLNYNKSFSAF